MTVLTIGVSPYIFSRNGKINSSLLTKLQSKGHDVASIVYHHDVQYFLPSEIGVHQYEVNKSKICPLFPFLHPKGSMPGFFTNVCKKVQPNVIITIGDYTEFLFVSVTKARYPNLFKWIAIVPQGCETCNERFALELEMADCVVTTTEQARKAVEKITHCRTEHIPFGPDHSEYFPLERVDDDFAALYVCKNDQMSNIGAFLGGVVDAGIESTLHYNRNDTGEYDIPLLIKRFGIEQKVALPDKFTSVRDGLSAANMNQQYNNHQVVVDCSMQSATALSLLEGMATGCIPIGMNFGAAGEILNMLPEKFRFIVPHQIFIGPREEEYAVMSKELGNILMNIRKDIIDPTWFEEARNSSINISKNFRKDMFAERVNEVLESVVLIEHAIIVDSF